MWTHFPSPQPLENPVRITLTHHLHMRTWLSKMKLTVWWHQQRSRCPWLTPTVSVSPDTDAASFPPSGRTQRPVPGSRAGEHRQPPAAAAGQADPARPACSPFRLSLLLHPAQLRHAGPQDAEPQVGPTQRSLTPTPQELHFYFL